VIPYAINLYLKMRMNITAHNFFPYFYKIYIAAVILIHTLQVSILLHSNSLGTCKAGEFFVRYIFAESTLIS